MAGGDGEHSVFDYPYDESKYKGFWRYFNSETPNGRAGAAGVVVAAWACFFLYLKFKPTKAVKQE